MVLEDILKLPTKRLLAYYKKYYRHTCNPYSGDIDWTDADEEKHNQWEAEYNAIKAELDNREHVEK